MIDPNLVHNKPGIISVQAPEDGSIPATDGLKIESAGSLTISNGIISEQNINVRSTAGELGFSNTKLNCYSRRIAVSSPKKIRVENSSQLAAVTAVIMQRWWDSCSRGRGFNWSRRQMGNIMDQFDRITVDSATLMASVIRARVVSPSGVLQINNSALNGNGITASLRGRVQRSG